MTWTYLLYNRWYFVISLCLIAFLVGTRLDPSVHAGSIRILALGVAIFPLTNMLTYKYYVTDPIPRLNWLEASIYFDWTIVFLIVGLMFIEMFSMISSTSNDKKRQLGS